MGLAADGVAIYAVSLEYRDTRNVELTVSRLAQHFDRVDVIVHVDDLSRFEKCLEHIGPACVRTTQKALDSAISMHRQAMLDLFDSGEIPSRVLLTGSSVFGPVSGDRELLGFDLPKNADVLAPYWHACDEDARLQSSPVSGNLPVLDFTLFGAAVLRDSKFQACWRKMKLNGDHWNDHVNGVLKLGKWLNKSGFKIAYPMAADTLGSADPRFYEAGTALQHGAPCLNSAAFYLDPLVHDLNATDLRTALDHLREHDSDLYAAVIAHCTRYLKLRDFCTIADQYEIISDKAHRPQDGEEPAKSYAVFIHAFYAEMMPEFWCLIQNLSGAPHLFLTTATVENAQGIQRFLTGKGWPEDRFEIRVVAQNRGRDMSSLFITWRDVAQSGRFDIALRLHSKKTPQVARQVGEGFKAHLFDNLVLSQNYVRNVLDLMAEQADIGLIIPPVIHVGFGTLGHAWYNNKEPLSELSEKMDLDVPLDDHTPVGAFGTMYWFRMDALRKMFDYEWQWEDYNPEPHHIDGGLAHVQERLIAYCVQDSGHRVLQIMTAEQAARNYGRLEYKTQLYASQFASNNVLDHKFEIDRRVHSWRRTLYVRLRMSYGKMLRKYPSTRNWLRPVKNVTVSMLLQKS